MKLSTVLLLMVLAVVAVYALVHYTATGQQAFSTITAFNKQLAAVILPNITGGS